MADSLLEAYKAALYDTDREEVLRILDQALADGHDVVDLVSNIVGPTISGLADDVVADTAALSQHFVAARISDEVATHILEKATQPLPQKGVIVLGTARNDFHGLGRKIIGAILRSHMFSVIDLGLNVDAARFVDEALAHEAPVIGISAMMSHTAVGEHGALAVRRILQERNLESRIKIIVGGAPYRFDPTLYKKAGADAWAPDGVAAIDAIASLLAEVRA